EVLLQRHPLESITRPPPRTEIGQDTWTSLVTAAASIENRLQVHFSVVCRETDVGDELRLVGSVAALGNWDPEKGLVLRTSGEDFPVWHGSCSFTEEVHFFEYKYVMFCNRGTAVRWEEAISNRRFELTRSELKGGDVICSCQAWNTPSHSVKAGTD
ncbi:tam, partial [Symbiodinium sp. CCMP2592]